MTREEMVGKISRAKAEIMCAGPVHRRDLGKHIRRMEAELRRYDRFQAEAKTRKGVA